MPENLFTTANGTQMSRTDCCTFGVHGYKKDPNYIYSCKADTELETANMVFDGKATHVKGITEKQEEVD